MSTSGMSMTDFGKGAVLGAVTGAVIGMIVGKKKKRMSCMIKKLIKVIGGIAEIVLP